jgi:hypothetical protein
MNIANKTYSVPVIERIELDNEISLALESAPPAGPAEGYIKISEYLNVDPFKTNQA